MVKIVSSLTLAKSLHPKIIIKLDDYPQAPDENCHLDLIYELPASVFVDPYQLHNLETVIGNSMVFGEHDLELPLEKVKDPRGSLVIVRPSSNSIELPIHTRYQRSQSYNYQRITLKPPYAGWTCAKSPSTFKHPLLPNHIHISFAPLPSIQQESLELWVPVGKVEDKPWVTFGTFCVVLFCSAWIAYSVVISVKKRKKTEAKGKRRKSDY